MAAPVPYEPFLPWTEGAYYPLPSQVWLNNNGARARRTRPERPPPCRQPRPPSHGVRGCYCYHTAHATAGRTVPSSSAPALSTRASIR